MNFIYHHRTQGTGAEGVHISYIIKGLRELGHQVSVVSPTDSEPGQTAGDNPFAQKKGLKRKFLNALSQHLPQFLFELLELSYNLTAFKKIDRVMKERHADCIYERHAFFMSAGTDASKKYNIPLIVEVNEVAGEARVRRQMLVGLAKRIERRVFQHASAIIVVSDFLKQKIIALGIDDKKIHVIPNGADAELFDIDKDGSAVRKKFMISSDCVVTGFVGWFVPWHRLEEALRVFANVKTEQRAVLLLVGDGTLKGRLKEIASELGISHRVIFAGAAKYQDIPEYVAAMDICLIPGSNEYRSPIKMFEYMVMGKAVLAPSFKPITSVIEDNQNGLIFDQQDESSLMKQWQRLIKDCMLRNQLGNEARRHIIKGHLWSHNARRVTDIFNQFNKDCG